MKIQFECLNCNKRLSVDSSSAGKQTKCPECSAPLTIPSGAEPGQPPSEPSEMIFCPNCGEKNLDNNFMCTACEYVLHGPQPHEATGDDGTLGGLIPYKNSSALIAYYFSVFALIPCIGIPLGVVAIVLGIKGLKYAEQHPEAKGKAHAWTGIILGGICAAGNILLIALAFALPALELH